MLHHRHTVLGLFGDGERARDAITALKDAGFAAEDISLLMPDRGEAQHLIPETGTQTGGAATGAVAGGLLGGLGGWLVGVGALAIPGLGPFIAAGAFASALGGAAVGAGVGAIAGTLVGMGLSEDEARYYEQEVRGGQTLVAVRAETRWLDQADRILRDFGARAVTRRGRSISDGDVGGPLDYEPLQRSTSDRSELERPMVASTTTSQTDWADQVPRYRAAWQRSSAITWDEVEPYYRYLHDKRRQSEYRDRTWDEVEPELRRDWESRYPDRPWDRAADALRDAWESMAEPVRRASE
jgi:hypothetical protein